MNVKTSILVVEMVLWYVAAPSSSYFVIVEVFTKFLINSWQTEVTSSTQFAGSDVPNDLDLSDVLVNQLIESTEADFVPVWRIFEEVHQSFTKSRDLPQCIWVFSCIRTTESQRIELNRSWTFLFRSWSFAVGVCDMWDALSAHSFKVKDFIYQVGWSFWVRFREYLSESEWFLEKFWDHSDIYSTIETLNFWRHLSDTVT